jgi:selenium-binding protein 1
MKPKQFVRRSRLCLIALSAAAVVAGAPAFADETSCSPFTPLIKGQEDLVYVWTLGVKGVGDGSDKLVTVDVNPKSKSYGKVIHKLSVGGRGEVHHVGLSDDRRFLWGGALDSNKIFIFDIGTNPAKPKLVKTINDFVQKTGFVGPHSFYRHAGPHADHAFVEQEGPRRRDRHRGLQQQGRVRFASRDAEGWWWRRLRLRCRHQPAEERIPHLVLHRLEQLHDGPRQDGQGPEAMKRFGNTSVMWDMKTMKPLKVFQTPGAPLEVRWSWRSGDNWAVTTTALTSKIWVYKQDAKGEWQVKDVATIGDPAKIPLPVDISITADSKGMWINTFMDGTARYWDMSDPMKPKETFTKKIGSQVNMVSQSFDGKRVYFTTSLLGNWDKKGKDDEQFLKAYNWDGKDLKLAFEIDFYKEKLGRAHHMKFQARDLSTLKPLESAQSALPLLAQSR